MLITIWSGWMNSSWHLLHSDCWHQSRPLEDQERKISSIIERETNSLFMVIQIVQAMLLCSPNCLLRLETASLWQNVGIALSAGIIEFDACNCKYSGTEKPNIVSNRVRLYYIVYLGTKWLTVRFFFFLIAEQFMYFKAHLYVVFEVTVRVCTFKCFKSVRF